MPRPLSRELSYSTSQSFLVPGHTPCVSSSHDVSIWLHNSNVSKSKPATVIFTLAHGDRLGPPSCFSSQGSSKDRHIIFGRSKGIEKQARAILKENHMALLTETWSSPSRKALSMYPIANRRRQKAFSVCTLPDSSLYTFPRILMRSSSCY